MTHSNHRQGSYGSLLDDFIVLGFPGPHIKNPDAVLDEFARIGARAGAVNTFRVDTALARRHLVYDDISKVRQVIADLAQASLGLSVIVSGLRDKVQECCRGLAVKPHTECLSLGFWGKNQVLPHPRVLEVSTMCGHGRVSPQLVWELADDFRWGQETPESAAAKMGGLCLCDIFNRLRAARLIRGIAAELTSGRLVKPLAEVHTPARKDSGISIDGSKCTGCLECLPYCPVSAITENASGLASIDGDRCFECGVCWQSGICPHEAIIAMPLFWPRSLRGSFQSLYAPYRSAPSLLPAVDAVYPSRAVKTFARHEMPSELANDVEGLLRRGDVVIQAELGRPHVGTTLGDMEKVMQDLIPVGLDLRQQYPVLDERSPLSELAIDPARGILRPDILDERAGWVVLKVKVPEAQASRALRQLQKAASRIDTVFAVDVMCRPYEDGSTIADRIASDIGVTPAPNGKINLGLGRPLID